MLVDGAHGNTVQQPKMGKRCKLNEIQRQKWILKRCITLVLYGVRFRALSLRGLGSATPPALRRRFTRGLDERTRSAAVRAVHT